MTGIPWYYHAKTQIEKADGYLLHALMEIEKRNDSEQIISELDEYRETATYSLIFEHNRMEAAGLSRKETIELIQKWEGDKLALFKTGIVYDRLPETRRNSGDFNKQQKEVLQHFDALISSY